jgi:hypothetical protein
MVDRRPALVRLRDRFVTANLRSRSIRLYRPTRSGAFDLQRLVGTFDAPLARLCESLGRDREATVTLEARVDDAARAQIVDDLLVLARAAKAAWLETGVDECAIGWPFLEGKATDGTWVRGPLLLYPVHLERSGPRAAPAVTVTLAGPPLLNDPLAQTLERVLGSRVAFEDVLAHDDDGILRLDDDTWAAVAQAVRALGVDVDDNMPDRLEACRPRDRDAREAVAPGTFGLRSHVVLGRFPRAGSHIVREYDALLSRLDDGGDGRETLGPLGDHLLSVDDAVERADGESTAAAGDHSAVAAVGSDQSAKLGARRWQVLASDGSQDEVLRFVTDDDTAIDGLVVQGPPGTGKSQMLANLIAAAIAEDKRVLLLCQKRAALDVVHDRLAALGLGQQLALVHDTESDRESLYAALKADLEHVFDGPPEAPAASADAAVSAFEIAVGEAQAAWSRLCAPRGARPSLAALDERLLDDDGRPLPDLSAWAPSVDESDLLRAAPKVPAFAERTRAWAAPHPLALRADLEDVDDEALAAGGKTLDRLAQTLRALIDAKPPGGEGDIGLSLEALIEARAAFDDARDTIDMLVEGGPAAAHFYLFWSFTGGSEDSGAWTRVHERLERALETRKTCPRGLVTAPSAALVQWRAQLAGLAEIEHAFHRPFLPRFWRGRAARRAVSAAIEAGARSTPGDGPPPAIDLEVARAHVDEAQAWQALIEDLPNDNRFLEVGASGDLEELATQFDELRHDHDHVRALRRCCRALAECAAVFATLPDMLDQDAPLVQAIVHDHRALEHLDAAHALVEALAPIVDASVRGQWQTMLNRAEPDRVLDDVDRLRSVTAGWEEVREVDRATRDAPPFVRRFLRAWPDPAGTDVASAKSIEDLKLAMNRAWRTWLLDGEDATALEAPVAAASHLATIAKARDAAREGAAAAVAARWQARVRADGAHAERGRALRRLREDVSRQRNRRTLRQLVERYRGSGLMTLRPVWLCSPESVAALFPLERDLFDLVVFDEASQCPVESALPALVRARRAVVAGDDQQMPPAHFFQAADDVDDDEDDMVMATRSVLELARVAFSGLTLRWHYRSHDEALIAFSNRAFYGGRLRTAPRASPAPSTWDGFSVEQVAGAFEGGENEREAQAVIDALRAVVTQAPVGEHPSVGVVCLNRKQADRVAAELEQAARDDAVIGRFLDDDQRRPAIDQLFIRNLENVQGDERDVIILSFGYAPQAPGGRVAARFGPLSLAGGERRLNVAVTRARRGVKVVTSFSAGQLDVEHTKNKGPKLIKRYLAYVEAVVAQNAAGARAALDEAEAIGGGRGHTGNARDAYIATTVGTRVKAALAEALTARGFVVEQDLGLSAWTIDIAVRAPEDEGWALGVDCARFLAEPDPLVRDLYGPRFLARSGWDVIRVTPRQWRSDPRAVVDAIERRARASASPSKGRRLLRD